MNSDLPPGWKRTTVGDVMTLQRGFDLPAQNRRAGNVPIVSSSGTTGLHDEAKIQAPAVITGRYGTIGEVFFVEEPCWPLNTTLYVKDFCGNEPRYVAYLLEALDLSGLNDKTSVPGLNRNHVHAVEVSRAPLGEQRRIAFVLSSFDEKIQHLFDLAATLEALVGAAFSRLSASPATKSALGELGVVRGGGTPKSAEPSYWDPAEIVWMTPKDMTALKAPVAFDSARKISQAGLAHSSAKLLPSGTVLLTSRATIGVTAIARVPLATNQGFITVEPAPGLSSVYVLFAIRSVMPEIHQRAGGSTFPEINKTNFKSIPLRIAETDALAAFDGVAVPAFDRIAAAVQEAETLAAIRDTLLPKLISGQVRVPDTLDPDEVIGPAAEDLAA